MRFRLRFPNKSALHPLIPLSGHGLERESAHGSEKQVYGSNLIRSGINTATGAGRHPLFLVALVCAALHGVVAVAVAGPVGTASYHFRLNLDFQPPPEEIGAPPPLQIQTYYRPTAFYSDGVLGAAFESSFGDSLKASVSPYDFYTEIGPEWPLPSPDAPPLGGFLSYYSYLESGVLREGMIVGFRPGYVPNTDFDTLFASGAVAGIADVTEEEALLIMKPPDQPFELYNRLFFNMFVIQQPDLAPLWQYNAASGAWDMEMDLYAFSSPVYAGSVTGEAVFAPVPEPGGTLYLLGVALIGLSAGSRLARRRAPGA
jgi:hypothetical protein